MRFATIDQVNPLRRALAALALNTTQRLAIANQLRLISRQEALYNSMHDANKYSEELSYCYRPFDLSSERALHHFSFYSDRDIGGESTGVLQFDREEKALVLSGTISERDKEKLVQHPSIGMARTHPFPLKCGPFTAIGIEIDSDGLPIHLGVEVQSKLSGVVSCYGVIASRARGWRSYELPFVNMILVGAEEHQQWNNGISQLYSTHKDGTLLGSNRTDMRRIILTEADEVVLRDINLRLLGSKTVARRVAIRNLALVRRAHSERFCRDYLHPYFYIVEPDPYIVQRELGVSWLTRGYQHFSAVDLGDKKYLRKEASSMRNR